jgi:hypothetical protein
MTYLVAYVFFVAMLSFINQLSYRQIQNELKKRQLDASGKKNDIVKRFKTVYEKELNQSSNVTNFHDLPNEIYCEIFDYLCPLNIINSFSGLNHRLNGIIGSISMKLNFKNLNKNQYKRVLKQIVPKIISQTTAIEFGQASKINHCFSPEVLIDLFTQSFNLTQFSNLRFLSLTSPNFQQLESLFSIIPNLLSLQSLRLLEHDYCGSQNETICKLILANNQPKSNHLSHVFIETSPPFKTLLLLQKHFLNKISFNYLQLNIRCALFFYPHSLTHLECDSLSGLVSNMTYLKIDILLGTSIPAFNLIQRFPQINHLSIKTISQAYANGYQWAELLAQMPNIIKLDLHIHLDASKSDQELPTFQTKFWLQRQWIVQCIKKHPNLSECQIIHRDTKIR